MKHITTLTLFCSALLSCCHSPQAGSQSVPAQAREPHAIQTGLPHFANLTDAIAFGVEEANIEKYTGLVFGSEHFKIALPSGGETDNWTLSCYFRDLFKPFGTDAYRELVPLLDHPHQFVRWGSYFVLQPYMNLHGLKRHTRESDLEIARTREQLLTILDREGL